MKLLRSYSKPEEAHLAASVLESYGIETNLRDVEMVSNYWLVSDAIGGVKLEVPEKDLKRAAEILDLPGVPEDSLLACPHCQSTHTKMQEIPLLTGLLIFFGFLIPSRTRKVYCLDCGKTFPISRTDTKESSQS